MSRNAGLMSFAAVLLAFTAPSSTHATSYEGTCYHCASHSGTWDWGERCQIANGDGQGLVCQDSFFRDNLTGTTMWVCAIPVSTPCAGGTFNYGPGSGGTDACTRDPMTGVCPASCFSCAGGTGGGGGIRV